jgi:DNA-binding MarR family transcriptional regulator
VSGAPPGKAAAPSREPAGDSQPPAASLETSLLFDVFALSQAVGRLLAEAMRGGPLTPSEYAVYSAIFELEAATPTELAGRLGMRLTTFADHVRGIERRGHARRIAHPTDGRSHRIALTAEGMSAHRAANTLFERASAAFALELGVPVEDARAVLGELREAADRVAADPASVSPRRSADRAG